MKLFYERKLSYNIPYIDKILYNNTKQERMLIVEIYLQKMLQHYAESYELPGL